MQCQLAVPVSQPILSPIALLLRAILIATFEPQLFISVLFRPMPLGSNRFVLVCIGSAFLLSGTFVKRQHLPPTVCFPILGTLKVAFFGLNCISKDLSGVTAVHIFNQADTDRVTNEYFFLEYELVPLRT